MASRKSRNMALFGDAAADDGHDRQVEIGVGYVRAKLGPGYDVVSGDKELRRLAEIEVARPEWATVDPRVRRAYVSLYGRAAAPTHKLTPHERQAVAIAIGGGPAAIDYDAAERAAIEEDRT